MSEVIRLPEFQHVLICHHCKGNEFIVGLKSANPIVVEWIVCADCEKGLLEKELKCMNCNHVL